MPTEVQSLESLLASSAASDQFKAAVREVQTSGRPVAALQFSRGIPAVKALRAVSKLLEEAPELAIDSVSVEGASGCSDFEGVLQVNGGEARFQFRWCCAWRAEQEGYKDHFGYPDQIRAAREFGYQCFERFQRIK